jgi:hypothetical protein
VNEKYIQFLRNTIQTQHGCNSRYVQTVAVKFEGNRQNGWHGNVEVFDMAGHPQARQCYAWGFKDEAGHWQYVAILKISPIDSPQKAVELYNADAEKKKSAMTPIAT